MDKIHEKLDKITNHLTEIDKTLIKQEANLERHILRTDLAEENIEMLRKEIRPLKKHVESINSILQFIGIAATILVFLNEMGWLKKIIGFFF